MWKAAIQAVKTSDQTWITRNRRNFSHFFQEENEEPAGKLGEAALSHHYQEGLFKMFLAKEYHGQELSLPKGSRWIENFALLNSNWGWLIAIGVGGAYFAGYMSPGIAGKYFLPKEALISGSGKPGGTALSTSGGSSLVNGSWRYCSGSEQASLFTAVTKKDQKISAFILPVQQARIERDWNAIGLDLTCSHTVIAENTEIPGDHFFDLMQEPSSSDYPLSSYPFMGFAQVCFVPVVVGITRAFWMEVEDFLENKQEVWEEFQPHRYEYVKASLEEHTSHIFTMKSTFYAAVEKSWSSHMESHDPEESEVSESGRLLAEYCYQTTSALIPKLGMSVLKKEHPLQELWQDLQTAYQHMVFHSY